jgi:hypothetical protein
MPFASEAQRKYLYAKKPDVAKKFAIHEAKKGRALPSTAADYIRGKTRNNV